MCTSRWLAVSVGSEYAIELRTVFERSIWQCAHSRFRCLMTAASFGGNSCENPPGTDEALRSTNRNASDSSRFGAGMRPVVVRVSNGASLKIPYIHDIFLYHRQCLHFDEPGLCFTGCCGCLWNPTFGLHKAPLPWQCPAGLCCRRLGYMYTNET